MLSRSNAVFPFAQCNSNIEWTLMALALSEAVDALLTGCPETGQLALCGVQLRKEECAMKGRDLLPADAYPSFQHSTCSTRAGVIPRDTSYVCQLCIEWTINSQSYSFEPPTESRFHLKTGKPEKRNYSEWRIRFQMAHIIQIIRLARPPRLQLHKADDSQQTFVLCSTWKIQQ